MRGSLHEELSTHHQRLREVVLAKHTCELISDYDLCQALCDINYCDRNVRKMLTDIETVAQKPALHDINYCKNPDVQL